MMTVPRGAAPLLATVALAAVSLAGAPALAPDAGPANQQPGDSPAASSAPSRPAPPAQPSGRQGSPSRPFKTGIEVVMVTATVFDASGALASGLTRDDFDIIEDGSPQQITHFDGGRVPVSVGLLLDISDSMRGQRIVEARAAVSRFLFELLSPDDEFFVTAFNHESRLVVPWMNAPGQAAPRLDTVRPWGSTAIYDAVLAALPQFEQRQRQRAAMVLISDGADTASDANVRDVRTKLLRSDAFVYAVAVDTPDRRPINRVVDPYALREITDDSGGRTEVVRDTSELGAATARIAEDLNHQYVLGYAPGHQADGRYHSIRVRVKREGYKVRARRGYVAGEAKGDHKW
jgi:Ca-activated chloride channel family protein